MKLIISLLYFLSYFNYLFAAQFIEESIAKVTAVNKVSLPDVSAYSSVKVTGGNKSNLGKSGIANCGGHRIEKQNKLEEQQLFCNVEMSDYNKYSFMQKREKTDTDAGIGKTLILDGTGPFNQLSGKEFIYAEKYMKSHAFFTTECNIPEPLFNLLKK